MAQLWTRPVKRYYVALVGAALLIDAGIEPYLGHHYYADIWSVTGVTVQGDPLLILLSYPVTALVWLGIIRALQLISGLGWRTAYYSGFTVIGIVEEVFNQYIFRLWTYTDRVAWTDSFWVNLPIIILLGWIAWIAVADLFVVAYDRRVRAFTSVN